MRWFLAHTTAAIALSLFAYAPTANAGDEVTAQALFVQARDAMKAGNYEKACPMFEESLRLLPGDGTKFNLGDCYEKTGRTASAWAAFRDVAASSKLAGQKEREGAASARATSLEKSLCRMSIEVASQDPPTVLRDGEKVGAGQWGIAIPVDPGMHAVVARSPGKKTWTSRLSVGACPAVATVAVPVLENEGATPHEASPSPDKLVTAGPSTPWRPISIIASLGLGVVATGLGTYFGIRAWTLRNESNDGHCTGNTCDDVGRSLRSDSLSAGTASTITFVAGGALLALGTVLWLTDSKAR